MTIRAILFDLDRTLLDRDQSFHDFVLSQYERFSQALAHIPRQDYVSCITALDDRGRTTKDKVYQAIIDEFKVHGISPRDLQDDFESRITDYYVPFPHLRECLDELKSSGYQLGLVSNGRHDFQMRTIRTLKIEQDFEAILISESEGVRKPEPEIFERALRKLDSLPSESVFVGDHPDVDIQGARAIGMKTIWKKNDDFSHCAPADESVDDLEQLPSIVRLLENKKK